MAQDDDLPAEDDGLLAEFRRDLLRLKGDRTYDWIAKRAGYARSTIHEAVNSGRLPKLDVLLAFVGACGGAPDDWRRRHQELFDRGKSADKELARARAELGRLGAELERLRQVCDDPTTAAFRAERQRDEAESAQQRAQENQRQLNVFVASLRAQVEGAEQQAGRVLGKAREEAESMIADAVARGKASADRAASIMRDADNQLAAARAEAERIRGEANADGERIRQQAQSAAERIEHEARAKAQAEAANLVDVEIERRRELAVRLSGELISAAGADAEPGNAAPSSAESPGTGDASDSAPNVVDNARILAAEIIARAREQAEIIRRVAMNEGAILQTERTRLRAEVERLESRLARQAAPLGSGRHRRVTRQSTPGAKQPAAVIDQERADREPHPRVADVRAALTMTDTDKTAAALAAIGTDLAAVLNAMDPDEIAEKCRGLDDKQAAALLVGMRPEYAAAVVTRMAADQASPMIAAMNPLSSAKLFEKMSAAAAVRVLAAMNPTNAANLISYMEIKHAQAVIKSMGRENFSVIVRKAAHPAVAAVLSLLPATDAADLLRAMQQQRIDSVLRFMSSDLAGIIRTKLISRPRRTSPRAKA